MSCITIRGKILLYRIVSIACIVIIFLTTFFLPFIRIEWNEEIYDIDIEYYANLSLSQYTRGNGTTEVHSEDLKELEELFDESLMKMNVEKFFTEKDSKNSLIVSTAGLMVLVLFLVIMLPKEKKNRKELEMKVQTEGSLNELTLQQKTDYFSRMFNVHMDHTMFVFIGPLFGLISILFSDKKLNAEYDFSISIPLFLCFLILCLLAAVLPHLLAKRIVKEAIALNVANKNQLNSMPYFGVNRSENISANSTFFAEESVCKTSDESTALSSNAAQLLEYKKLLDAGAITQEEFDQKKKELVGL